jgi:tetratricopeptide (TPR) repeat protein
MNKTGDEWYRYRSGSGLGYCIRHAFFCIQRGAYDEAIADYTEGIRIKPDYARLYDKRGMVCAKKHAYAAALADFDEALRLAPDFAAAEKHRAAICNILETSGVVCS